MCVFTDSGLGLSKLQGSEADVPYLHLFHCASCGETAWVTNPMETMSMRMW